MTGSSSHFNGAAPSFPGRLLDVFLPSRRAARTLAQECDRLEAFSRAIPLEYCGWDSSGVQAVSPGFCALFGAARADAIEDVLKVLSPPDAAALESLYARLSQYGEPFTLSIPAPATEKSLKIFGRRGILQQQRQVFSVLWAMDVSDMAALFHRGADVAAQAERRESDLRAALNALPFPVWLRGEDLDISWCNKAYARAVDDTPASVVAEQKELPLTGASRAQSSPRVLAQKALSSQAAQSMRGHMVVGGQRRLLEIVEQPLSQEKRVVGAAIDMTKEEEITASYALLSASQRETLEQLRTAIAMFDADTKIEFYNSAYEQLSGLSGTWLDTKPKIVEIIDKMRELRRLPEQADYKQFKQQWLARFTSLLEPYEEMQYLPDNTVLRLSAVPRPMGGLLLTLEDVTSRLQLETSYNTLIAVQKETLDNLAEGIAVFGEDGRLKLSNEAFSRMWRVPAAELGASPHIAQLSDRARGFFDGADWEAARGTIVAGALERAARKGRLERNDGTVLEYSVVPLPDGNILNAWFDITDTAKVEQALMEKNAALEAAEKLKTDFLANVSYQLRTPLNAIMGFTEMLHHQYFGPLNDRQRDYTGNMIEAGQRLISLVNDILDLSTIEAGYLKLYPAEIRLKDLFEQVAHLVQDWARKQKLEIAVDCAADMVLFADERRIKQVLLNLVSNAINYSPNGGLLTFSAKETQSHIEIAVSDTGMGIPKVDVEHVFTPFEKIHSQKVRRRSGAGLGLSLVKSIIQLHGGDVRLESREGAGTTVTCRLPLRQAD